MASWSLENESVFILRWPMRLSFFLVASAFSGGLIADGGVQSLNVVYDVKLDSNGKSVITPRVVTIDQQDQEKQLKEEEAYEATRAALYRSDSIEDRILRRVGLRRCGTIGPGEIRKSTREELIEDARLTLSDTQLNSLLARLLKSEPTLTQRQVRDIFQILHQGGDDGWSSIDAVSSGLNEIAGTAFQNFPPWAQEDDIYDELVRDIYELGEMRLRRLLEKGVPEDQLRDDTSIRVLDKFAADSRIASADLKNEIQEFVKAVRSSGVGRRWR